MLNSALTKCYRSRITFAKFTNNKKNRLITYPYCIVSAWPHRQRPRTNWEFLTRCHTAWNLRRPYDTLTLHSISNAKRLIGIYIYIYFLLSTISVEVEEFNPSGCTWIAHRNTNWMPYPKTNRKYIIYLDATQIPYTQTSNTRIFLSSISPIQQSTRHIFNLSVCIS